MSEQGRKYDGGKLRYDLIPVLALEEMVKGLTYGTIKYDDNNWVKVPEGRKRYLAAALRHIQEYRKGNLWDEEQDIHHLAAAINNLSFIVEKDLQGWEDSSCEEDISQEELKSFIESVDNSASQEGLWYPPVEEGRNPWIEWQSGYRPESLENNVRIELLCVAEREYEEYTNNSVYVVEDVCWKNYDDSFDIVAYRIVD